MIKRRTEVKYLNANDTSFVYAAKFPNVTGNVFSLNKPYSAVTRGTA